jgi:peroxiredoxin
MRKSFTIPLVLVLTACKGEPTAPRSSSGEQPPVASARPLPAMKPNEPVLAEPSLNSLGTAPSGFGLEVGEKAPDAVLPDVTGVTRNLSEFYAQRPTLLVFYRGGWCPFCNLQLHEYSAAKPQFDARGVGIVAISVDKPSEEAKTQAKHGVAFPMLSDSKLVAHQAYRVVHAATPDERRAFTAHGLDLTQSRCSRSWTRCSGKNPRRHQAHEPFTAAPSGRLAPGSPSAMPMNRPASSVTETS